MIDGRELLRPDRHRGYVPQKYSLFPDKNVLDNRVAELGKKNIKVANTYGSYEAGADWFINKKNTAGVRIDGVAGSGLQDRYGNS